MPLHFQRNGQLDRIGADEPCSVEPRSQPPSRIPSCFFPEPQGIRGVTHLIRAGRRAAAPHDCYRLPYRLECAVTSALTVISGVDATDSGHGVAT